MITLKIKEINITSGLITEHHIFESEDNGMVIKDVKKDTEFNLSYKDEESGFTYVLLRLSYCPLKEFIYIM